jgi:hypothetical protein
VKIFKGTPVRLAVVVGLLTSFSSLAAPDKASIAWMDVNYNAPASYTVRWDMWWGDNANVWHLLENNQVIHTAPLTANTPNAQNGALLLSKSSGGSYIYQVRLCDTSVTPASCTDSDTNTITVTGDSINQAPVVNAGIDASAEVDVVTSLNGSYTDDGKTAPISQLWAKFSGQGNVFFSNTSQGNSTATFSEVGTYALDYTVDDTELSASDRLTVTVTSGSSLETPFTPEIAWRTPELELTNGSANVDITWNKYSGVSGNYWYLLQDGVAVYEASIAPNGNSLQTATGTAVVNQAGSFQYTVKCFKRRAKWRCL